ncbi:CheA signal transduction histidine kinase [Crinalium epipsammum PCC 9333]|uniref:histidine kinase n=1 Tax=Crinalium epipsammum PCC 9333 TaxID=1173022 RepID=K9VX17_9CYAN|nr:hybrid sensor histidine kinase/response regulator [Crinalium epipsammum]AFZ12094.1 CheA signal transduction histidine kinase [Crinalium epipsammum PCC 9333]
MQPEQQQRIMGYFIEEAKDHLNTIEKGLLNLQETIQDAEIVNEVFRAAHSIKGGAAMLGISSIQKTAHRLEDCFKLLRDCPVSVDQKLESLFLKVFDTLQALVEQLETPFGLTDETASGIMSGVEPVFGQLTNHLQQLLEGSGQTQDVGESQERVVITGADSQARKTIQETFQTEVLVHLRSMLQLFKQPDSSVYRSQLQALCRQLGSLGERFGLPKWSELLETSRNAIANQENSTSTLARVIIKEIKQAQDLVLATREVEILPSQDLKALLPKLPATAQSGTYESTVSAGWNNPTAPKLETNNQFLFTSEEITSIPARPTPPEKSLLRSRLGVNRNEPEFELSELDSLAELFDGEQIELDESWQEEDIFSNADSGQSTDVLSLEDEDFSTDFSDFLLEENGQVAGTEAESSNDDFMSLFGEDIDSEPSFTPQPQLSRQSATEVESPSDDFMSLFGEEIDSEPSFTPQPQLSRQSATEAESLSDDFMSLFGEEIDSEPSFTQTQNQQVEQQYHHAQDLADENLEDDFADLLFDTDAPEQAAASTQEDLSNLFGDSLWSETEVEPQLTSDLDSSLNNSNNQQQPDDQLLEILTADNVNEALSVAISTPETLARATVVEEDLNNLLTDLDGNEGLFSSAESKSDQLEMRETRVEPLISDQTGDHSSELTDDWQDMLFEEESTVGNTDLEELDDLNLLEDQANFIEAIDEQGDWTLEELLLDEDSEEKDFSISNTNAELESFLSDDDLNNSTSFSLNNTEENELAFLELDIDSPAINTQVATENLTINPDAEDWDLDIDLNDSLFTDEIVEDNDFNNSDLEIENFDWELDSSLTNQLELETEKEPELDPLFGESFDDETLGLSNLSSELEHQNIIKKSKFQSATNLPKSLGSEDLDDLFVDNYQGKVVSDIDKNNHNYDQNDNFELNVNQEFTQANHNYELPLDNNLLSQAESMNSDENILGSQIFEEQSDVNSWLVPTQETAKLEELFDQDIHLEDAHHSDINKNLDSATPISNEVDEMLVDMELVLPEDATKLEALFEDVDSQTTNDLDFEQDWTVVSTDTDSLRELDNLEFEDLEALLDEPAEASQLQLNEFDDLEALLDEPAEASQLQLSDFDDLEALLDEPANAAVAKKSVASDASDFGDLEALLDDSFTTSPPVAATTKRAIPPAAKQVDDEFGDLEKLLEQTDKSMGGPPTASQGQARPRQKVFEQTMRVPVKHLDSLSNLVGELVVNRNSLEEDQERMRQSLDNLLNYVQQLSDVGSRMQNLYERSLLESSLLASRQHHRSLSKAKPDTSSDHSSGMEYDPLEMDRFTPIHLLSQEMIELIVRVRESSSDIEFLVDETDQVARMLRQVTSQVQEGLTRSRMIPFAQTADRLQRGVRENARKNGKEVELYVEGRDTLLDKVILEHLTDPLNHMLNNAIAHGIETPDERQAIGKSRVGRITLRAFHQGNQTVIAVSDDGAGINTENVKQKAVKKGLITAQQAQTMSKPDIYDLLFHPGFSTKDQADELSGRGVGMDVVRTSLLEIRGTISTESVLGKGTNFTIRLPLTLSIGKALCCVSEKATIAFPMDGVEDMLEVPKDRIQTNAEGQSYIMWRDTRLTFQPLTELLTYNRQISRGSIYGGKREDDMVSIIVLRSAGNYIGLHVDRVLGEQEIVIKQLQGPVPKPVGIAGATVLGDGRIMPIADVLELIELSRGVISKEGTGSVWSSMQAKSEAPAAKSEPMVLIVDDSITVRELLSMTFNKSGYRVEQARDGQEAWDKLLGGLPCDIVFCDIEMPRMDGLELLSRIQKNDKLNHLPVAMLTSRGASRHQQMAAELGASGYFTKPYLEEALLDAAQRMMKGEVLLVAPSSNG